MHRALVDVNHIPCHKDWCVFVFACYSAQPCTVEEVTHTFGGTLQNTQAVRLFQDRTRQWLCKRLRITLRSSWPYTHLSQVRHGDVGWTDKLRVLHRTNSDTRTAVFDLACGLHVLVGRELDRYTIGNECVVLLNSALEHRLHVERVFIGVGCDDRVPVELPKELYPDHVELRKRRATPLTCFEQDNEDGQILLAQFLHETQVVTLCAVEFEGYHLQG